MCAWIKLANDDDNDADNTTDASNNEDVNMSISKDGVYINGKRVDDDDKKEKKLNMDAKEVHLKINEKGISAQVKGKKK